MRVIKLQRTSKGWTSSVRNGRSQLSLPGLFDTETDAFKQTGDYLKAL